jgi:hypothetical protein
VTLPGEYHRARMADLKEALQEMENDYFYSEDSIFTFGSLNTL